LVVLAAAAAALGGVATAADLPIKTLKAPPPVVAPSWSGFYLGVGVGFRSTQTDATVTNATLGGANNLANNCAVLAPQGGCVTAEPVNDTAFRLNPYVGFNWQVAPQWVVGVEGDYGWASKTTTLNGTFYPSNFPFGLGGLVPDTFSVKTTWDASARGRAGFLVTPSVLVYATGGAAWLHVESTSSCSTNPVAGQCRANPFTFTPAVITDSKTKTGWTIGGGVEAMLWGNWLARAEYRYADYGTITNTDIRAFTGGGAMVVTYDLAVRTHTAQFGLAYKFGASNPVAADMPVKAPVLKAPPVLAASWTGAYLGAGVGMRSSVVDATVTNFSDGAANLANTCATFAPFGGCVTSEPLNNTAFRIGPYLGFNWQVAPQWVVGVEGDWAWVGKTTTLNGMFYPFLSLFTGFAADTFSVRTTWDASARGRIGYLVTPSVLVYATGGAAWLHVESTSSCSTNPLAGACSAAGFGALAPAIISDATTKTGGTIGGGIEAMLWGNWIARGEYRYADFGTISQTDTRIAGGIPLIVSYDLRVKTHTASFGLAYKFDWPGAVVAKY